MTTKQMLLLRYLILAFIGIIVNATLILGQMLVKK